MGQCKDCGEETDNYCIPILGGKIWYKCQNCFDKEGKDAIKAFIISLLVVLVFLIGLSYLCA